MAINSDTGVVKVIPCPSKAASPYAIAGVKQFVQRLETGKVRVRTDAEAATKASLEGVVDAVLRAGRAARRHDRRGEAPLPGQGGPVPTARRATAPARSVVVQRMMMM